MSNLYGPQVVPAFLHSRRMLTLTPEELARLDEGIGGFTARDRATGYRRFYDSTDSFMRDAIARAVREEGWYGYVIPNDDHWVGPAEDSLLLGISFFIPSAPIPPKARGRRGVDDGEERETTHGFRAGVAGWEKTVSRMSRDPPLGNGVVAQPARPPPARALLPTLPARPDRANQGT